jgi:hypothetical protein
MEYGEIFKLNKFFKLEEFLDWSIGTGKTSYPEFLDYKYNSFWTRLMGCPVCFGVWLNIPVIFMSPILFLPCCLVSWVVYFLAKKIINY